jgi:SAM-dependent methyltransferase
MNSLSAFSPETMSDQHLRSPLQYRRENRVGIQTLQWQEQIVESIVRDDGKGLLDQVTAFWKIPSQALVLDVGSRLGSFVFGYGRSVQVARGRIEEQVFAVVVGENLLFANQRFDLITMNQLLEHLADQVAVLRAALRVLKPVGVVYVACPNCLRFYEPHPKISWLPLLLKMLGRVYLRLRGRNPVLLDQCTHATISRLRALLSKWGSGWSIVDMNRARFLEKFSRPSLVSARAPFVARAMGFPGLGRPLGWAALQFLSMSEGSCEMVLIRNRDLLGGPS